MSDQRKDITTLLPLIHRFIEERIPFNRILGLKVDALNLDSVQLRINMRDDLIGNPVKGILHGGVICSVMDVAGGITAAMGVLKKMVDQSSEEISKRLMNVGTIDLRVDYLRPGLGEYFLATGAIMRAGKKVAVIRMQLHNDKDILIAVGTGTYIIG